jgi:putative ABC transport system permease protein
VVINKVSIIQPLPIAYRDKILQVPGVKEVTFATWFGGTYVDEKNFFPQFAIDPETWHDIYPEYVIPPDQWKAFLADRQGAIAGEATAERFGWKIGDRIPIKGSYLPGMWEFNLRGIYTGKRPDDDTTQFWFQRTYLDENGPQWYKGDVGWYVVKISDPDDALKVAKAIDEKFSNSPWETKTDTEKAFAASFAKQMGNIEFLILSIGGVVFFTLLLVTGNTMAIAVRERTNEFAVLKTVGFTDRLVLALVLGEAFAVSLVGGGLGLILVKGFAASRAAAQIKALVGNFYVSGEAMGVGIGLAVAVGLAAGILPAISAMRLRVVDALRRV